MPYFARVAPELHASDLGEAIGYYENRLGFRTELVLPESGYAIVERDAVALHIFADPSHCHSPVSLHVFSDQLDELCAELKGRGARLSQEIVQQPWGNRDFRVTDPSGNVIKFTEPLPEL